MITIKAYSDFHGMLPIVDSCDLLFIAGDVVPVNDSHTINVQNDFIKGPFREWLKNVPAKKIIITPGNHDFIFECCPNIELPDNVELLIDKQIEFEGIKIWGSPWVPNLPNWAFYANDSKLKHYAEKIPEDTNIWLMHGPPFMYLDQIVGSSYKYGHNNVGNKPIVEFLQKIEPELYICGHVHEAFGADFCKRTNILNVSFVDEYYKPQFRHYTFSFEKETLCFSIPTLIRGEAELAWDCFKEWNRLM